jgi:hypothetical protein
VFGVRLNQKSRVISKKWTKEKLDKHYGKSAPSIRTVYSGFQIFGVAI